MDFVFLSLCLPVVRVITVYMDIDALTYLSASDPSGVERIAMAMSLPC